MAKERIQELFGEAVIRILRDFASRDIKSVSGYSTDLFGHIADANLRESLAEVYYGCRWFLKIALAVQTDNEERKAIARWQVIDFASICESLLLDCCRHGLQNNHFSGTYFRFYDPPACTKSINWTSKPLAEILDKRSFAWLIEVAANESIVSLDLHRRLTRLRNLRNTVHLAERAKVSNKSKGYQIRIAKLAYKAANDTITSTRDWLAGHP